MSLIVKQGEDFVRELPPKGLCKAVCWKVWDVGNQPSQFGARPMLVISFETEHRYTQGEYKGKRILLHRLYGASLGVKKVTDLRKDLQEWRGRNFNEFELKGFDIEKVQGKPVMINVVYQEKGDKVYANVGALIAWPVPKENEGTLIPLTVETPMDYVPVYVKNLLDKRIVQEMANTNEVAEKGWNQSERPPMREPSKEEAEIF